MRSLLTQVIPILSTSTILLLLVWRKLQLPTIEDDRCRILMKHGRWSHHHNNNTDTRQWQPYGCQLHVYDKPSITKCLSSTTIHFVGDSIVREIFWAVAQKLGGNEAENQQRSSPKHADVVYLHEGSVLRFRWDPFLNSTETLKLLEHQTPLRNTPHTESTTVHFNSSKEEDQIIVISTGLWQVRYLGPNFPGEYRKTLDVLTRKYCQNNANVTTTEASLITIPPPALNHAQLDLYRAQSLTKARISQLLEDLREVEKESLVEVAWATRLMTEDKTATLMSDGLHVTANIAREQAGLLLNRICNNKLFAGTHKSFSMCCVRQPSKHWEIPVYVAVVAASIILCVSGRGNQKNNSTTATRTKVVLQFIIIITYCWLADRTTLFDRSNKIVDEGIFLACVAVVTILGFLHLTGITQRPISLDSCSSIKHRLVQADRKILSRPQTEEWKGWMQIFILLYHHFGMSKILWAYQVARILVGSYLFLTGYGHAAYFLKTNDFSTRRAVTVLLRMNLLPCALAIIMDNHYDIYYFPLLASMWFLLTFSVLQTASVRPLSTKSLTIRICLAILSVQGLLKCRRILELASQFSTKIYGPSINAKELLFRVGLDAYSPFVGMAVAVFQNRQEDSKQRFYYPRFLRNRSELTCAVITLAISSFLLWLYVRITRQFPDKFRYNEYHPLISILPMIAYVIARNAHPLLRRYHATTFAAFGKYSLELFILQYHIWLANDTKGLLRLGLIDRVQTSSSQPMMGSWTYWLETLIITFTFFWLSKHCADATNVLVRWIVGEGKDCHRSSRDQSSIDRASNHYLKRHSQCRSLIIVTCLLLVLWLVNFISR